MAKGSTRASEAWFKKRHEQPSGSGCRQFYEDRSVRISILATAPFIG